MHKQARMTTGRSVETQEFSLQKSLCPVIICPYLCSSENPDVKLSSVRMVTAERGSLESFQAAPNVRLPRACHFCACRARRGNSRLAKSSLYAGPSAGTEVTRLRQWHVWSLPVLRPPGDVLADGVVQRGDGALDGTTCPTLLV